MKWPEMTDNSKPAIYRDPFKPGDDPRRRRGRKVGSRAKLAVKFFEDTYAAWEEQGESALARAAFHDPMGFVSMVARLMPQKIEVSTPTDGMSDERLAEMLEFAERMAALRGAGATAVAALPPAHAVIDQIGSAHVSVEEGGGGPDHVVPLRGVNTPNTFTAAPAEKADAPVAKHNFLEQSNSETATSTAGATEHVDSQNATALPYPVGRPFPKPDHVVERENRNALASAADDDIDPASLF